MQLSNTDPLAQEVTRAIQTGDTEALGALLSAHKGLATCEIVTPMGEPGGGTRSLLHVAADWPGHFPNVAETIRVLIAAGAPLHNKGGKGDQTPLHWAAASNDVAALDALLEGGANIEAPGGAIGGGAPLMDALAFGCWDCAHRLIERGAEIPDLWQAATIGRMDLLRKYSDGVETHLLTGGLWGACWGGQRQAAEFLLDSDANINWVGWQDKTPLDAASTGLGREMVPWLRDRGAKTAKELQA